METDQRGPAFAPDNPAICTLQVIPSQWSAVAFGGRFAGLAGNVPLKPTAQPSILLMGLLGGPKLTEVRLYADELDGKSGNFGAGTRFQVAPS